jgi:Cdc6-like AAA superfamily ATPase
MGWSYHVATDIGRYLRQRKSDIGRESRQVRDFSVFDFNHIPEHPIMRNECRCLIDALLRFDVTGVPTHQAIIGSRGSGKTLTYKYLQQVIPAETGLSIRYVNCRHHNTSYRILANLLGERVAGASLTELFNRFMQRLSGRTAVVLDEVDLMSPKDTRREILYLLSRSERPCAVIMLSNSPHIIKHLDAATRSSLQPELVHFRNYDAEQIRLILEDRATRGLRSWKRAQLAEIAALTVRNTNADARVAIKTLYYAVSESDASIAECFDRARRDIVIDVVNDLSDANLFILRAAATSRTDLAKAIYDRYCQICHAHREKPFSYVYYYSNLSYLQSVGLVALVSTKVERTYTNRVLLAFDRTITDSVYKLRFADP